MSWNTWNSQDFPLVDKNLPLNAPFRARLETGLSLFFLRQSGSIYTQLLQNDALFPGADTNAAEAPSKRGGHTKKKGTFAQNRGRNEQKRGTNSTISASVRSAPKQLHFFLRT